MVRIKQVIKKDFVRFTRQNLFIVRLGIGKSMQSPTSDVGARRAVSNYYAPYESTYLSS